MTPYFTAFSHPALDTELPALQRQLSLNAGVCGLSPEECDRLALIVEELFINTTTHGLGGAGGTEVMLALGRDTEGIHLRYCDAAPAFDLAAHAALPADEAMTGGLGVTLIHGLCRRITAGHVDGRNVYELLI